MNESYEDAPMSKPDQAHVGSLADEASPEATDSSAAALWEIARELRKIRRELESIRRKK